MPRIYQNAEKDATKDFVAEINAQRGRYGLTSQKALGEEIGVCQATAGNYLRDPQSIPLGKLRKMIKVLRLDPLAVLIFLGYSRKDLKSIALEEYAS